MMCDCSVYLGRRYRRGRSGCTRPAGRAFAGHSGRTGQGGAERPEAARWLAQDAAAIQSGASPRAHSVEPATIASRTVSPLTKSSRKRNKAHLVFVASQPCLICQRTPCDAHHLKFAQPKALGRKVGDEFTVPVCRDHHHELHRHGNEAAWWANLQIAAANIAKEPWQTSPIHGVQPSVIARPPPSAVG
jgi:hypothetical protein